MAWQGPNYTREGHVLFPHYHFNHYGWIRDYYVHRYHAQRGIIVDVPAPRAGPGNDGHQDMARMPAATHGQTTAKTNDPAIPANALPPVPSLPDAPPYIPVAAEPPPHPVTPAPHPVAPAPHPVTTAPHPVAPASHPVTTAPHPVTPAPHLVRPRLTPGQLQHHFANVAVPQFGDAGASAVPTPKTPRLAAMTVARTERSDGAGQQDSDPPHHGFTVGTLVILVALMVFVTAASAYIIRHLFFRGLRAGDA